MEISEETASKCLDNVELTVFKDTVTGDTVEEKEDGEEAAVEAQMDDEATVEPPPSPSPSQMTEIYQESDEYMGEEEPTVPVDTVEVKEEEITVSATVEAQMEQEIAVEAPPSPSPAPSQLSVICPASTDECMDNEEPVVPLDTVEVEEAEITVEDKNEETTVVRMEEEATVGSAIDQDTVVNGSIEEVGEDLEEDTVALKLSTTDEPFLTKFPKEIDTVMMELTEEELLLFGSGSCGLIEVSPEMEEELLRDCF